jgi:hypothetical protein
VKRLTIAAAVVLLSLPAVAQQGGKKMYRCGNNYQDRPCDAGGAAAPKAAGAAAPAAPAPAAADAGKAPTTLTRAQQQRQIRCENFGRQLDELKERQKSAPQQAEGIGVQIKSLESRMNADSCT